MMPCADCGTCRSLKAALEKIASREPEHRLVSTQTGLGYREDQQSVGAWQRATFGPPHAAVTAARTARELGELLQVVVGGSLPPADADPLQHALQLYLYAVKHLSALAHEYQAQGALQPLSPSARAAASDECADLMIMTYGIGNALGSDVLANVDRKMSVNRRRVWVCNEIGENQHLEES